MNTNKLDQLKSLAEQISTETEAECAKIIDAIKRTGEFLDTCQAMGLTSVGINDIPKKLMNDWPFRATGNAFGTGPQYQRKKHGGLPQIWEVARIHNVHGGCGNLNQVQLIHDAPLIDGVYTLRSGKWSKETD